MEVIPEKLEAMLAKNIEFTQEIVDQHHGMIKMLAMKYTEDPTLFRDLMQEGWIGAHLACEQYVSTHGASLTTYIYQRARSKMQQYMNYKNAVVHVPIAEKANYEGCVIAIDGHDKAISQKTYSLLMQGLDEIEDGSAEILKRRFIEGESVASLTTEYGVNRKAINERIENGLEQLRKVMS